MTKVLRIVPIALIASLSAGAAGCAMADAPSEEVGEQSAAIRNGSPDYARTYVGAVLRPFEDGWRHFCSGSLVASNVILTAGHCTDGRSRLAVTFAQNVAPGTLVPANLTVHEGNAFTHPEYNPSGDGAKERNDLGVIVLDAPVAGAVVPLAREETLSRAALGVDTPFTIVGYGAESALGLGNADLTRSNERRSATVYYNALTSAMLKLTHKLADATGTTCFGDSGGPALLAVGGVDTLVGVQVIADGSCQALSLSDRVDTAKARAFLGQYLTLP